MAAQSAIGISIIVIRTFELVKLTMPDHVNTFWFIFSLEQRETRDSKDMNASFAGQQTIAVYVTCD